MSKFREGKELINMWTDPREIENTLVPDTKGNQICGNVSERHVRVRPCVGMCGRGMFHTHTALATRWDACSAHTMGLLPFMLTYCQGFLPYLFLPFWSIYLNFFPKPRSISCPVLAVANTGSFVGPQNKIGHPAGCRFPC